MEMPEIEVQPTPSLSRKEAMTWKLTAIAACLAISLAGCSQTAGPKEGTGTVLGAVIGGVIGNQFGSGSGKVAATAAGALIGGLIGSDIGRSLDEADRRYAYEAEYSALDRGAPGTPVAWRNPSSGHYGQVVPGPRYEVNSYSCRDYTHTVYIDGRPEVLRGTACRQPDGTWRAVS